MERFDRGAFGARLAAARRAVVPRMTQDEAARVIGKNGDALSKYERGEVIPTVDTVAALAMVYGVTVDSLVNR